MFRRLTFLCSITLALAASSARAQVNYDTVQVRSIQLARGVYMLTGSGGNMGLSVGTDAAFVVDDQFAPLTPKVLAAIKAITPDPVKFVLNTHWHFDHTGGNEAFGPEATIIAHENVRKRMEKGQSLKGEQIAPAPPKALPVITFGESLSVNFNGEEIRILHYPHGHTDGDSVIFFTGSNVVHMGDDYFAGRFPTPSTFRAVPRPGSP